MSIENINKKDYDLMETFNNNKNNLSDISLIKSPQVNRNIFAINEQSYNENQENLRENTPIWKQKPINNNNNSSNEISKFDNFNRNKDLDTVGQISKIKNNNKIIFQKSNKKIDNIKESNAPTPVKNNYRSPSILNRKILKLNSINNNKKCLIKNNQINHNNMQKHNLLSPQSIDLNKTNYDHFQSDNKIKQRKSKCNHISNEGWQNDKNSIQLKFEPSFHIKSRSPTLENKFKSPRFRNKTNSRDQFSYYEYNNCGENSLSNNLDHIVVDQKNNFLPQIPPKQDFKTPRTSTSKKIVMGTKKQSDNKQSYQSEIKLNNIILNDNFNQEKIKFDNKNDLNTIKQTLLFDKNINYSDFHFNEQYESIYNYDNYINKFYRKNKIPKENNDSNSFLLSADKNINNFSFANQENNDNLGIKANKQNLIIDKLNDLDNNSAFILNLEKKLPQINTKNFF